jgi:hypothetical protein
VQAVRELLQGIVAELLDLVAFRYGVAEEVGEDVELCRRIIVVSSGALLANADVVLAMIHEVKHTLHCRGVERIVLDKNYGVLG